MSLKQDLKNKRPLLGTFLKTPSPMICEVLGRTDLDIVCIDAEHAPFDRRDVDACIYALNTSGKSSLVRVPVSSPEYILTALDCGATGVLAPHIITGDDAERLARLGHFGKGRGYAGSTRAAGYGAKKMDQHKSDSAETTTLIAQIEDVDALRNLDDLFSVRDIDAFFIGRSDLSISMGADGPDDPDVVDAVKMICDRGTKANVTIGMFTSNLDEVPDWLSRGARLFLLGSDHGFILKGAGSLTQSVRANFNQIR